MKRKKSDLNLSQAVAGYLINLNARQLSDNTISDYTRTLQKFQDFFETDLPISKFNYDHITSFMSSQSVSNKTLSNYHSTIKQFWNWMIKQNITDHSPIEFLDRPKPEKRVVDPVPNDEIKKLLEAARYGKSYSRPGKKSCRNRCNNAERNVAIILFFIDNGIRVSELCNLQIKDLDYKNQRAFVFGKNAKERFVPFSSRTSQAIWRYHSSRGELYGEDYVFVTDSGRQLTRNRVCQMIERLAERAEISHTYPHRLRHTFAVNYLRAGGDIFTLQMILGHEQLDMVRHYSKLANADVKRVHRRASPVEFLRL